MTKVALVKYSVGEIEITVVSFRTIKHLYKLSIPFWNLPTL